MDNTFLLTFTFSRKVDKTNDNMGKFSGRKKGKFCFGLFYDAVTEKSTCHVKHVDVEWMTPIVVGDDQSWLKNEVIFVKY